jgi:carbohydrate-selective porin OprB
MPYYFSAGLVAYGPLDIRPKDFVALGLAYGVYSDQLRPAKLYEATLEISYGIQVLPGLIIQPGAQILINPGGSPSVPSAMALGVNAIVSF